MRRSMDMADRQQDHPLDPWKALVGRYQGIEQARLARERSRQHEIEARRTFDAWVERTTEAVMRDFLNAAAERSLLFERNTGARVLLKYPAHRPIGSSASNTSMRTLEMHLREARLHFYSFAETGSLPQFYFMPTQQARLGARGARRYRTLISVSACFAMRVPEDGYELRLKAGLDPLSPSGRAIGFNELTMRAFTLLIEELERVAAMDAYLHASVPRFEPRSPDSSMPCRCDG